MAVLWVVDGYVHGCVFRSKHRRGFTSLRGNDPLKYRPLVPEETRYVSQLSTSDTLYTQNVDRYEGSTLCFDICRVSLEQHIFATRGNWTPKSAVRIHDILLANEYVVKGMSRFLFKAYAISESEANKYRTTLRNANAAKNAKSDGKEVEGAVRSADRKQCNASGISHAHSNSSLFDQNRLHHAEKKQDSTALLDRDGSNHKSIDDNTAYKQQQSGNISSTPQELLPKNFGQSGPDKRYKPKEGWTKSEGFAGFDTNCDPKDTSVNTDLARDSGRDTFLARSAACPPPHKRQRHR